MDPETNRYILMNESKGLVPGYSQSMLDTLGKSNIAAVHGSTHRHIRPALLSLLCPSIIRSQLLPKLDDFMRCHLSNWDNTLIDIQQNTKEMAFLSSLNQIASIEWESMSGEFMPEFFKLVLGTLSLPINFPGTNYHCGFQVIFATSRLATIVNGVLRKTTQDMELNVQAALPHLLGAAASPGVAARENHRQCLKIAFQVLVKALVSMDPGDETKFLKKQFQEFMAGLMSLPINIPGSRLHNSLQAS
ncbi:Cytochrome P450 85A [Camellia lanceoleosa]|uniref:Cytochrome P450 85A n=1 Tax=Camellia lanceoleosa TaxID=1840588 RepID=A0ACC0FAS6_9ERIC|nr:Cytochrome P450 85A [Camellia lanceoleosa]